MKKFILPVFALFLAIGFSAFTEKTVHKSTSANALHYFFVDGNTVGNYIGDYDPNSSPDWEQLKDDADCDHNTLAEVCALGFETMTPEEASEGIIPLRKSE